MLTVALLTLMLFVTCKHPPHPDEWSMWAAIWAFVVSLCGALWILSYRAVRLDKRGLKIVRGIYRRSLPFTSIQRVELNLVCLQEYQENAPSVLLLEITARSYVIPEEICFFSFADGEGQKLIQLLHEQVPDAYFNEKSLTFLKEGQLPFHLPGVGTNFTRRFGSRPTLNERK